MRKCLGVLAGVVVLCVMSWAQDQPTTPAQAPASPSTSAPPAAPAPSKSPSATLPTAPTPQESTSAPARKRPAGPEYPRLEWFGGYSYAQAGFFNSGHWAGLNGWNASFTLNATHWFGLVVDGNEYFGNSKINTLTYLPFPPCEPFCPQTTPTFNVKTRQYNILFGGQFAYRKHSNWTPFGEVMYGHGGVRGAATAEGLEEVEVSSGRSLLAGGGLDHKINERFALRMKADYLQTATAFSSLGRRKQDNLVLSIGVVIRSVHKKKRRLEDETQPEP